MTTWIVIAGVLLALVIAIVLSIVLGRGRRRLPDALRPGNPLPSFRAVDERGSVVDSHELHGSPAVILFVRGNWCPFCSRQVANLTRYYKAINESGARLILVTPKPLETTRRVAQFFEVEFEFWLDEGLAIGEQFGLIQEGGVPSGYRGEYGEDTLWPAALVTDADGVIRYASISKLLADRPNPEKLLEAVEAIRA